MALLSDQLVEIGLKSNPKSNMSMGESAKEMLKYLQDAQEQGTPMKQLYYTVELVCKTLNNNGRKFFQPKIFFS
jgi:hypothetical protein